MCYGIEEKDQLLLSINNFLDETVVLPPGDWDRENQIGLKEILKLKQKKRLRLEVVERMKKEREEEERAKLVEEIETEKDGKDHYDDADNKQARILLLLVIKNPLNPEFH